MGVPQGKGLGFPLLCVLASSSFELHTSRCIMHHSLLWIMHYCIEVLLWLLLRLIFILDENSVKVRSTRDGVFPVRLCKVKESLSWLKPQSSCIGNFLYRRLYSEGNVFNSVHIYWVSIVWRVIVFQKKENSIHALSEFIVQYVNDE